MTGDDLDNAIDLYNDLNRYDLAEWCPDGSYLERLSGKHGTANEGHPDFGTSFINLTGEDEDRKSELHERTSTALSSNTPNALLSTLADTTSAAPRSNERGHSEAFSVGDIADSVEQRGGPPTKKADLTPMHRPRRANQQVFNSFQLSQIYLEHHPYLKPCIPAIQIMQPNRAAREYISKLSRISYELRRRKSSIELAQLQNSTRHH